MSRATTTAARPADLGRALSVKATHDAARVRLTTTHDGMIFTACLNPAQARALAVELMLAADCASTAEGASA